jgi:hypothetical protein
MEQRSLLPAPQSSLEDDDDEVPLSELVTIVVVTSPIVSHPSTELLDRCLSSLWEAWPCLQGCRIVVAADGCRLLPHNDNSNKPRRRRRQRVFGKADAATLQRYYTYLDTLQHERSAWLTVNRPLPCLQRQGEPAEPLSTQWQGFALTLHKALVHHVTTPLVWVTPHDYELNVDTLHHHDVSLPQLAHCILKSQKKKKKTQYIGLANPKAVTVAQRHAVALEGLEPIALSEAITLQPCGLWKENPHLASVQAYQDFVFGAHNNNKNTDATTTTRVVSHQFKPGHFIEDTLGQCMLHALKERQGTAKRDLFETEFGTYLLILSASKQPCTNHINGINYKTIQERDKLHYTIAPGERERVHKAQQFVQQNNVGK